VRPQRAGIERHGAFLLGLLSALERLASHRLLDRLIRGRAWLVLVTFALIGIVTLQLALLKLNGAVGRALHSAAVLQRENAALSIENSELTAADRVQAGATQLGMAFASSASLRFLAPSANGDFAHGAAALSSPLHAPGSEGASAIGGSASEGGSEGGEASASEAKASEAGTSEAAGAPAVGGGSEASSTKSSTSAASSEAPASSQSPEASSASETSPAGGTQATPSG
jgi:cell division protein FtsL